MKKQTLQRILLLIRPGWMFLALSLLFAVMNVALTLYVPVLIGDGIDLIVAAGRVDFAGLVPISIRLAAAAAAASLAQWLMNLCNNRLTYRVVRDLRVQTFAHIQELPLRYIDGHPHGDTVSRVINDADQISDGLLLGFSQLFTGIATIFGTLAFMLGIDVKISLVVICITPVSLFVASFVAKRSFHLFRRQSEARAQMTAFVEEMVGNQKVVKAFLREQKAQEQFEAINQELKDSSLSATFFSSITNPCTRFVNGLVYAGVGVFGALSAIGGRISVGQLSCFLSYANQYTKPFNEISGVIAELQNALACAQRVFELLDEPVQEPDAPDAVVLAPGMVTGDVQIEHVDFSYVKQRPLVRNLNLSVKPGERVAIVGPTGCGKTTLMNLLMRFYETDGGTIRVSGYSSKEVTRDSLRANYGMVLQETWLKSGTIAENIAYGKPQATREEIERAARAAYAHGFIRRMPDGYDTVITEAGGNLSQGQKQLLCIARVMLILPPMLILDEATSSIDTRTEIRIQRAFDRMMQGRTSFVVAHRLSTVRDADVILVMDHGQIVEQGSHEELLAKKGFYLKLYNSQWEGEEI